ncbi:MAG: DNA topoisomerase-1 [Arenicella sp.]|jgi:DNA topoisomerase-1
MLRLIDSAYFRLGNNQYSADNDSYGITTLRSRHLSVDDNELNFEYRGKSGVEQSKTVVDDRLARIINELDDQPGYRIFKYFDGSEKRFVNSDDLNAYIKELMGEAFSAKDFRTWEATMITAAALAQSPSGGSEKGRRKIVIEALGVAAERLGNTPKICEENYVDPRVIEAYMSGLTIADFNYTSDIPLDGDMSKDELATIDLLECSSKGALVEVHKLAINYSNTNQPFASYRHFCCVTSGYVQQIADWDCYLLSYLVVEKRACAGLFVCEQK